MWFFFLFLTVTAEFGGVEECLASMYTGIFTEDSTSYYGFRAPVVLPCSTPGLGYTYRTRKKYQDSHIIIFHSHHYGQVQRLSSLWYVIQNVCKFFFISWHTIQQNKGIFQLGLAFPASHSFRLYTLPVDSWYEAVDNSYGNQFGLLEFVIFRFRVADLNQPIVGDRYWVGYLRRHKMEFGAGTWICRIFFKIIFIHVNAHVRSTCKNIEFCIICNFP